MRSIRVIWMVCVFVMAPACMHQQRPSLSAPIASPPSMEMPLGEVPSDNADLAGYCTALQNSSDPFFGTQQREKLTTELEHPTFPTLSWRVSIMRELARDYLRFGEAGEAIRLLEEALDDELREKPEVSHEAELLEELAVASMKMGELDNCVSPDGRLICALPLDDSVVHKDKRGSNAAVEYLTRLLELEPENIKAMWLLNVAHMTLGDISGGSAESIRGCEEGSRIGIRHR